MINSWPLSSKLVSSITCHCDWINYLMHFKFLVIASWPRLRIPNSFLITRWGWSELCQFLFPQFNSVTQLCLTLCDLMDYSTQAFPVHRHSRSLFKLMSIKSVILSNHIILCCSLLLPPSVFPKSGSFPVSQFFAQVAKGLGFQLQHQSFQRIFRTDIFRIDWLNLLAIQWTLKSLLQYHSSKASIHWRSAFFIVQLSHPYMTTGKTIVLTKWSFVGKVLSLFNMLSRWVIAFLPRSKSLLISWLQSPSAVILEPPNRVSHCFHCFSIYLPWSDETGCHDLSFLNVEFKANFFTFLFPCHQEVL